MSGDEPKKSDDEPEYKKWAVMIGAVSGVLAIFVAVNTLTGFNPFEDLDPPPHQRATGFTDVRGGDERAADDPDHRAGKDT
ncbi:hypothetical protein [Amycolatopsis sp. WAC 01375]|uniref:hypothetical protein n=1 Tax=Amycolatopsis sp. WAC 01375 TaxID=2203194 RepID=UPI001F448A0C|nr:hypothetical protein [Amycolatopsis sp. WAC 01375]